MPCLLIVISNVLPGPAYTSQPGLGSQLLPVADAANEPHVPDWQKPMLPLQCTSLPLLTYGNVSVLLPPALTRKVPVEVEGRFQKQILVLGSRQ